MKRTFVTVMALTAITITLQYCSSSRKTAKNDAPKAAPVSYKSDIIPLLQASCTPCHFPPDGRKEPLNSYEAVKKNIGEIITRVKLPQIDAKFMPFRLKNPL